MFMETFIYQITYLDPGCGDDSPAPLPLELRNTQERCECLALGEPVSETDPSLCATGEQFLDPGTAACKYDFGRPMCEFVPPPEDATFAMIVALVAVILATPLFVLELFLLEKYIAPPTEVKAGEGPATYNPFIMVYRFWFAGEQEKADFIEGAEADEIANLEEKHIIREETELRIENLQEQREELVQKSVKANFKLAKHLRQQRTQGSHSNTGEAKTRDLQNDFRFWQEALREFDQINGFNANGDLRKPSVWEKMTGNSPFARHRRRIKRELEEMKELVEAIAPLDEDTGWRDWEGAGEDAMSEQDRNTIMWEQHRLDRLSFVARQIYVMNALEFDEQFEKPVPWWKKLIAAIILVIIG